MLASVHGILAAALVAAAAPAATPPLPSQWVTDEAQALSPSVRQQLDARLEAYERATGHQVIVWIGQTTGGAPLEEWAARTFAAWGVGRRKLDDGLAVFLLMQDRRIRIEVGYGLEPVVPDAVASQIIEQDAVPWLRRGNADQAVLATVDALLARIGGEQGGVASPGRRAAPAPRPSPVQGLFLGLLALLVLIFIVTHPRLALFLLFNMTSGRGGRGGGGWGGGGFSPGGGRSGGGGASGSW